MAPNKQATAILRKHGSRHYTKAELAKREAQEVIAPIPQELHPPSYLPTSLAEKFQTLALPLIGLGLLSELDVDALARYLIAESNYLRVSSRLTKALNSGNLADADKLSTMQDRFFKQCRAAGADLGLTVSSRCNLSVPSGMEVPRTGEEVAMFGE